MSSPLRSKSPERNAVSSKGKARASEDSAMSSKGGGQGKSIPSRLPSPGVGRTPSQQRPKSPEHSGMTSKGKTKMPSKVQSSPINKRDPRPSTSKAADPVDGESFLEAPATQRSRAESLPMNALLRDEPRQAWNANLPRRMSGRLSNPFPGSKKYHHYPVSCEFCNRKFQPGSLQKHIQKYHPDEHLAPSQRGRGGKIAGPSRREEQEHEARSMKKKKSPGGGMPRQLKICYICGRLFGSKSLAIHETKCLEKWRVENERLPKNRRMPEPVKPVPMAEDSAGGALTGTGSYKGGVPSMDPEAEAAYRSHLRNLIPCMHCGRTFNPDRVLRHENACVERPRRRKLKPLATA